MQAMKTIILALAAAALAAAGCDRHDDQRGRPREREQEQTQQPAPPMQQPIQQVVQQPVQPVVIDAQPQYVIVQTAPPPLREERRPETPSADMIWIDGYWNWNNKEYAWEVGHYERPPHPDVIWVAPRYETEGRGVRFTPGRWSPRPDEGRNRGR